MISGLELRTTERVLMCSGPLVRWSLNAEVQESPPVGCSITPWKLVLEDDLDRSCSKPRHPGKVSNLKNFRSTNRFKRLGWGGGRRFVRGNGMGTLSLWKE